MKPETKQFPAGTYYVGDLCYFLRDEWEEVCNLTFKNDDTDESPLKLKDGRIFVQYGTAHGDGEYSDQWGRKYDVDSGMIGCIKVKRGQKAVNGGQLIKFEAPFDTYKSDGVIYIGGVEIDTDPDEDEDECCPHCGRYN